MHCLITGRTGWGKTYLAERLCESYRRKGIKTLVLDPGLTDWPASHQTADPSACLEIAKANRRLAIFIDEAPMFLGRNAGEMGWLAFQSRHYGHRVHFIGQQPQAIDPNVRWQCSHLYTFRVSRRAADHLAEDFAEEALRAAPSLPQYVYFEVHPGRPVARNRLRG